MRTWTDAEENAYTTTEPEIDIKIEIRDSGGTLRDFCDLDGRCLVESVGWSDNLDQPMANGEAVIVWSDTDYDGMSPFVTGGRYEGYLAEWREIVISTKVYPPLADASAFSWREVFRGRIDSYDLSSSPGRIQFRDKIGAELMDQQIQSVTAYGDDDGAKDVEDVIADILTDHDKTGATLLTPAASSFQVRKYNQTKMRILQACRNLAFTLGWDIRSKWYESGSAFRLTLYEPDRSASTPDYTIPHGQIADWSEFGSTVENIRNAVRVWYGDPTEPDAAGNDTRSNVVRTASTSPAHDLTGSAVASSSIDKFGWRLMEIAEASSSVIQDSTAATALADYAIADLAEPTLIGRAVLATYFWPVELNDYYEITADGYRLGATTDVAIFGYAHSIQPGGGAMTEIALRAKPGLGPAAYHARAGETVLQPDDLAPDAPTVAIRQTPLGVLADVVTTNLRDYDQVLFFVGDRSDFQPNAEALVQASKATTYNHQLQTGTRRQWLKVQIRDLVGNISAAAGPFPLVAKKADARQLSQALQAKTMMGLYADVTVTTGDEPLIFTKYQSGEFLGDYNVATGQFFAREGGTYRFVLGGQCTTAMTEGTDFTLSLIRDPDGDAEEVARAVFVSGTGTDEAFNCDVFVPLDAGDEVEVEVVDLGGTFGNITFRADYTTFKAELVGTQQRSKPYPFVEADPVFLDHGPSGNYSTVAGECHAVFRLSNGEVIFTNGAAGAAHAARLHRNEVATAKARSITYSGSSDFWYSGVAETADRHIILCTHKEDATTTYGLRKYAPGDLSSAAASSDLGSTIEPRCVCHADNVVTDNPCYLGTVESGGVGKVRSLKTSDLAVIATSSDLGAGVNSIAHLNPQEDTGGIVVAMLSDATAPDIVALDAGDVTATELWRIQLDALATAGTSDDACELKTSPDADTLYAIGGTTNPTIYAISPTGDIIWSEDLGDHSELADITGCLSLDVHPTTGDVAVLCYYDNTTDGTKDLDCVTFDPDGNYRWAWRELGELDPADDPDWTSDTTGHRIAFATDGAIWVSGGGSSAAKAKIIKPFSEIPDAPPGIVSNALIADFDAEALPLADGAAVTNWPANRDRRSKTLADGLWRLENDTGAEQPTFRGRWRPATVDSVARTQTKFAAVEFDGTERLIGNIESTILADGAVCVLVCEPVDATGDYFSAYEDTGSAAAPLIELENASSRLEFRINVDGSQDTNYSHASRAGLQVIGCRGADITQAGIWLNNAKPNKTAAEAGTDATPDGDPRIRLGQAGSSSGDWFAGWVYRWIWLKPSEFSAGRVTSVVHWARQYYEIPELAVEVAATAGDPADLAGPVQYLTSSENHIDRMSAKYLTSQCLIASRGDQGVQGPLTCIPEDGGSANWAVSSASPLGTNAHDVGGIAINAAGTYAWIWVEEDGTGTPSANSYALWRIDLSDGSVDYTAASTTSGESGASNALHVAIDETNGNIWVDQTDASNELNRHDLSTGADDGVTANDGGLGTLCAFCMSPDDDFLIAIGDAEYIAQWAIPITGTGNLFDGYSTDRVDFGSGGDTTNATTSMQRNRGGGRLEPARDGSNTVWFCAGDSTADDPFVYQYDPDVATVANRIITEIDVSSDMDYTDTGTAHVRDIAIDKDGKIYCLVLPGSSGVDYDIVRYDSDGTFDLSFRAEGVTIMANATYGLATRIAVSEDYVVWVSTDDGYIITYEQ